MKLTIILFALTITTSFAQSQAEMNQESRESYEAADKELNNVYQQIKKKYADDKVFLTELKNAQLAWIKLRDADVKMMFPDREPGYYGSMMPMCMSGYMTQLTKERTEKLRLWLGGSADICEGSVRQGN
jgi:uncharacterized protein YecT (DUF1311 family)